MPDHDHGKNVEEIHERRNVLHQQKLLRLFDLRQREVRIALHRPKPGKCFPQTRVPVVCDFFNEGVARTRYRSRRSSQRSPAKDRSGSRQVEHRAEECVEPGSLKLSRR